MHSSQKYDTIIIGAGLAGIACAIRLRNRGKRVLVLEKNASHGGKLAEIKWNGYRWDKGPSLFTEPNLIEELFALCNKKTSDYFEYEQLDRSCTYHFPDSTAVTLFSDPEQRIAELDTIANDSDQKAFSEYIQSSKKLYNSVGDFFVSNPIPGVKNIFQPSMLKRYPTFMKRQLRKSLHDHNTSQFESDKLIQIFNRFGTYNGSNPYEMSGLYSMISHLELDDGTFAPKKGMRSIVDSLYALSLEIGVEYAFNETVSAEQSANGYSIQGTDTFECQSLVCAIDHVQFYSKVLKDNASSSKYKQQERSTSGLVFYWAMNASVPQLGLHNIIFSDDYKKEADTLWNEKSNCDDPTIYINVSAKTSPSDAPENCENWFVMVNTPAGVATTPEYRNLIKQRIVDRIKHLFDIDISDNMEHEEYWDSTGIEADTGSYLGAIYGSSSNSMTSALKRHKNKSKAYKNLYFCGGTVHPGGGIPLVLRSAKIVDEYIA